MVELLTSMSGTDEKTGKPFDYVAGDKVSFDAGTEQRLIDSGQALAVIKQAPKKAAK